MTAFMTPATLAPEPPPTPAEQFAAFRKRYGWFTMVVVLPCLLMAIYLYGFAADQYESESHFIVKAQGGGGSVSSGIGAFLGLAAGMGSKGEAEAVSDYLLSHDAVASLAKNQQLVALFRRPEADKFSRLPQEYPMPEELLRYYLKQVNVDHSTDSGITDLRVRAFRPHDAYVIASALLRLGEQRVNEMNARSYRDAVAQSQRQMIEARAAMDDIQRKMTAFRLSGQDIDPAQTANSQQGLVARLNGELAGARADLNTTRETIGAASPQYKALVERVRSLQSQIAAQSGVLTGGNNALAGSLGQYEPLRLEQEFYAKRYDAATGAFEAARQQALRQQLYIVRVVDPNMPVKSLYPKRLLILLTMFAVLLVVYGIGWLIAAGTREHAA